MCCGHHEKGIIKQPGPAEALKQMLFRLQAVEAELQRQQQSSVAPTLTDGLQAEETPVKQVRTVTLQVRSGFNKEASEHVLMGKIQTLNLVYFTHSSFIQCFWKHLSCVVRNKPNFIL